MSLKFLHPEYFFSVFAFFIFFLWYRKNVFYSFFPPFYRFIKKREIFIKEAYFFVLFLIILASGQPVFVLKKDVLERKDSSVFFLTDLSATMRAVEDGKERFNILKNIVLKLIDEAPKNAGIIGFSSKSFVVSPLTEDREFLKERVKGLSSSFSDFKKSVSLAVLLAASRIKWFGGEKFLVLLSDGFGELDFSDYEKIVSLLRKVRAKFIYIEFGSEEVLFPLKTPSGTMFVERKMERDNKKVLNFLNTVDGKYFQIKKMSDIENIVLFLRKNFMFKKKRHFEYELSFYLILFSIAIFIAVQFYRLFLKEEI